MATQPLALLPPTVDGTTHPAVDEGSSFATEDKKQSPKSMYQEYISRLVAMHEATQHFNVAHYVDEKEVQTLQTKQENRVDWLAPVDTPSKGICSLQTTCDIPKTTVFACDSSLTTLWSLNPDYRSACIELTTLAFKAVHRLGTQNKMDNPQSAISTAATASSTASSTMTDEAPVSEMGPPAAKDGKRKSTRRTNGRRRVARNRKGTKQEEDADLNMDPMDRIAMGNKLRASLGEEYMNPCNYLSLKWGYFQQETWVLSGAEEEAVRKALKELQGITKPSAELERIETTVDLGVDRQEFLDNLYCVSAYAMPIEAHLCLRVHGWCLPTLFGAINHSCKPNAFVIHRGPEMLSGSMIQVAPIRQFLVTNESSIPSGAEVTIRYRPLSYWYDDQSNDRFACLCDSCSNERLTVPRAPQGGSDSNGGVPRAPQGGVEGVVSPPAAGRRPSTVITEEEKTWIKMRKECGKDLHRLLNMLFTTILAKDITHPSFDHLLAMLGSAAVSVVAATWEMIRNKMAPKKATDALLAAGRMLYHLLMENPKTQPRLLDILNGRRSLEGKCCMLTFFYTTFNRILYDETLLEQTDWDTATRVFDDRFYHDLGMVPKAMYKNVHDAMSAVVGLGRFHLTPSLSMQSLAEMQLEYGSLLPILFEIDYLLLPNIRIALITFDECYRARLARSRQESKPVVVLEDKPSVVMETDKPHVVAETRVAIHPMEADNSVVAVNPSQILIPLPDDDDLL